MRPARFSRRGAGARVPDVALGVQVPRQAMPHAVGRRLRVKRHRGRASHREPDVSVPFREHHGLGRPPVLSADTIQVRVSPRGLRELRGLCAPRTADAHLVRLPHYHSRAGVAEHGRPRPVRDCAVSVRIRRGDDPLQPVRGAVSIVGLRSHDDDGL